MKTHTSEFKENIKEMGKSLRSIVTYGNTILEEQLYAVTPSFEGNLLKSIMKQLDIESSVDIPINTIINYKLGLLINEDYEYLDYGNYVVYKSEKKEDTNTYLITCYDKMLYSMKQNESLGISYPISIKNYLTAIGTKIGLSVKDTNFANQDIQIPSELYVGLEYTYRDILDEISQATGSNIIINSDDELEVKYFTETNDTINEEYLKDINVKFGEKYGPINSIVLSRSAESDNVYIQDEDSIEQNGLCEIKIVDNQIMNDNNRSDYLQGLLNKLNGLYFYLNDFNSTGICYYDPCDKYNIQIGENIYKCVMLNDEINITTGLEEIIHTDLPEQSETDYTKADKTDLRINQTTLKVDKQNQQIQSIITQIGDRSEKTTSITQDIDGIESSIQDIENVTVTQETNNARLIFTNINRSEPFYIHIHPVNENQNITYLYPSSYLYPSDELFMTDRILRFIRTYEEEGIIKTENIDYELPDNLLYYDEQVYDEFILDYDSQICKVIKRCRQDSDMIVGPLSEEEITIYDYPTIDLKDGDYEIQLLGYNYGYIKATLMQKNRYTTQFTSKVEMNSSISQTAEEINLEVSKKVGNDEVISKINQSAEQIAIEANKININGTVSANGNFIVDTDGNMICNNGTFNGGEINLTSTSSYPKLIVSTSNYYDTNLMAGLLGLGLIVIKGNDWNSGEEVVRIGATSYNDNEIIGSIELGYGSSTGESPTSINKYEVYSPDVRCWRLTQYSRKEMKKNFEELSLEEALNIIKNTDIYKYNLKYEDSNKKKHIGFIIGEDFKYSNKITAEDLEGKEIGVDTYSMISVAYRVIQEQQKQIEKLQEEINNMKGEKNNG